MNVRGYPIVPLLGTLLLLMLPAIPAGAQTLPVAVRHAGTDDVGRALDRDIRLAIAATPGLQLLEGEGPDGAPRLLLILATVDGNAEEPGQQTAASISILFDAEDVPLNGHLITALVQVCGLSRTAECASEILARLTDAIGTLSQRWPSLWRRFTP